jgi:hypothetical protein
VKHGLLRALATALLAVGASTPAAARPGDGPGELVPPWAVRRRIGIKVMPEWARHLRPAALRAMGLAPEAIRGLGLPPRELRRLGFHPRGQALLDLSLWPLEPPEPSGEIPAAALAAALKRLALSGRMPLFSDGSRAGFSRTAKSSTSTPRWWRLSSTSRASAIHGRRAATASGWG